jgi:ABC-2 type transport system permease protein
MSSCFAIARRDFRSFFVTRRGYILLGLVVALWGFYFFNSLGRYNFIVSRAAGMQLSNDIATPTLQSVVIDPYLQLVLFSFIVLIPLLAMRCFAEERQQGTYELLVTSPGSAWNLVIGKYLGLSGLALLFCAVAATFPLSLVFFGSPDLGLILSGIAGTALAALAFSGIALGCGTRTDRQLNAGVTGLFLLGALLMLHTPAPIIAGQLGAALELASAYSEASAFIDGYFSLQGVVYFTALAGIGLLASHFVLSAERLGVGALSDSRPSARSGGFVSRFTTSFGTIPIALLFLGVGQLIAISIGDYSSPLALSHLLLGAVALGVAAVRGGRAHGSASVPLVLRISALFLLFLIAERSALFIDLSDTRRYTVSERTAATLRLATTESIELRYVQQGDTRIDARAVRFLRQLASVSPKNYSVRVINPADYPSILSAFGIPQGVILQISSGLDVASQRRVGLREFNEAAIASAMEAILNPKRQRVYVLEAGEGARLNDTGPNGVAKLGFALEQEGFELAVLPFSATTIPSDADMLALIGPREPLPQELLTALGEYLRGRGKLFLALDPLFADPYNGLLSEFGVKVQNSAVVDKDQVQFSQGRAGLQPLVRSLGEHPVTNGIVGARAVVMNVAAPITFASGGDQTHPSTVLLSASNGSVPADDLMGLLGGRRTFAETLSLEGAPAEPPVLAAAISDRNATPRIILVGDSDWLLNAAFDYYSNRDFALNCGQWLVGNSWALVERARTELSATVAVSPERYLQLLLATILLAEGLILFGLVGVGLRGQR